MAEPRARELSLAQIDLLAIAVRAWVERHPAPDDPLLSFAGSTVLSPRQLGSDIAEETVNGQAFLRMVRFGVEVMPFEVIIARFGAAEAGI